MIALPPASLALIVALRERVEHITAEKTVRSRTDRGNCYSGRTVATCAQLILSGYVKRDFRVHRLNNNGSRPTMRSSRRNRSRPSRTLCSYSRDCNRDM
jgi:hypothetical protein